MLPVTSVRMAGRHVVSLAAWFSAGYLARYLLTWAGVMVGHGQYEQWRRMAATLVFTALVTVTLATVIGMLWTIRRPDDESFVDAIGRALFPFVVIYTAWGMYTDDVRLFSRVDVEHNLHSATHGAVAGQALFISDVWISLLAAAVAWSLRLLLERRREDRWACPVLAYTETAFNLFAVSSVFLLAGKAADWVTSRRFWPAWTPMVRRSGSGSARSPFRSCGSRWRRWSRASASNRTTIGRRSRAPACTVWPWRAIATGCWSA
ncbi:hypothetical protein GCM10029978_109000 [Actinoallomurus acanthiterrae]